MDIFEVLNGILYQWDTGRKILINNGGDGISEVHFAHDEDESALSVAVEEADGQLTAAVPDILLQQDGTLRVWAVACTSDGRQTMHNAYIPVRGRVKPEDYVYTPDEIMDYRRISGELAELEQRVDMIEDNGGAGGAVASVNGRTGEVILNAADVGALDVSQLEEAVDDALAQARDSGEFDGAQGPQGEKGETGAQGAAGVGIKSVTQTTTSTADKGTNVITVTKTDGSTSTFKVFNGSKGSTGAQGPQGEKGDTGAAGYTPVKGTDYFTDSDKAEMVAAVIAALPVYAGEVV